MYERLRNDLLLELNGNVDATVLAALDRVSTRYEIKQKETGLAIVNDELPEVAKIYLAVKAIAGLSEETLNGYRLALINFFRGVHKPPEAVEANDIRMYLYAYRKDRGVSGRTLDKYREYIGRFFTWALNEGYIKNNPAKSVESIKYETMPRESLTQVELEYLRMACQSLRDRAIVEVLYSTGCRVSELATMKVSDINWAEKTVRIFGKGKKHRISFLNAKAEVALRAYLDTRTDECPALIVSSRSPHTGVKKCGLEKIVRSISERSALTKHVTPHILRHTTATTALQSGMPVEDISKLLGHESIETTMIYAEVSMESVRDGHKKYIV